jgi:hypothetical protein
MKVWLSIAFTLLWASLQAQQFDVLYASESVKAGIGETVQSTLRLRNNDSKPVYLVVRKVPYSLGSTQRSLICHKDVCGEELTLKLEPGQLVTDIQISFYSGLSPGLSTSSYVVANKYSPSEAIEFDLNFAVEEPELRRSIYTSRLITMHDVYPNPAVESAQIDYKIHETKPSYTVIVRNLLGNIVSEYPLDPAEVKLKMRTEDLNTGIYFFSLYIDNVSVMTHKMMVKK